MPAIEKTPLPLHLSIDSDLQFLLRKPWRNQDILLYPSTRRASIKDIIEAMGIPHTEIGSLTGNGRPIDFTHIPLAGEHIAVAAVPAPLLVDRPSMLRPHAIPAHRFLADINVGKLASLLRMAGLDTTLYPEASDEQLVRQAVAEKRVLLTRDRLLLCRSAVHFGRLLRSYDSYGQLREVLDFFGLKGQCKPFSRCMRCNHPLELVKKEAILPLLKPLTRRYYHNFRRCPACGSIFWQGSHRYSLARHLDGAGLHWLAELLRREDQNLTKGTAPVKPPEDG